MRRFRLLIAGLVAVAMMSLGAAACTPEQQTEAGNVVTVFVDNLVFSFLEVLVPLFSGCPPTQTTPCPG